MGKDSRLSCPRCNTVHKQALDDPCLIICKKCGEIVFGNQIKPTVSRVPEDWSFIKTDTTGVFKTTPFTIIGRVRLQLRNDYKNFWCAALDNGKSLWILESFGSFAVYIGELFAYDGSVSKLKAGQTITMDSIQLKGEYVEKCEGVGCEGEISSWKLFAPGFFVVEASNTAKETALFTIASKENISYIKGSKVTLEDLHLKNIIEWNEWK